MLATFSTKPIIVPARRTSKYYYTTLLFSQSLVLLFFSSSPFSRGCGTCWRPGCSLRHLRLVGDSCHDGGRRRREHHREEIAKIGVIKGKRERERRNGDGGSRREREQVRPDGESRSRGPPTLISARPATSRPGRRRSARPFFRISFVAVAIRKK